MKTLGIILIIVGIAMIVLKDVNFQTKKEVADVGPIQINKTENHHIGWPVYAGVGVGVVGVIVLIIGVKDSIKQKA